MRWKGPHLNNTYTIPIKKGGLFRNKKHRACSYDMSRPINNIFRKKRVIKRYKSIKKIHTFYIPTIIGVDEYLSNYIKKVQLRDDNANVHAGTDTSIITYATSQVILDPTIRKDMTEGQHFAWRCYEWSKIEEKQRSGIYHDRSMLDGFMDMDPDIMSRCNDQLIDYYYTNCSAYPIGQERMIAIDSSFLTETKTSYFMKMIMHQKKEDVSNDGDVQMDIFPTVIFLETYITWIESLFKVIHQKRSNYRNIEFDYIYDYIQYSESRPGDEVGMKLRCSKHEVHTALKKREDEFFHKQGMYESYQGVWKSGIRNMINDHVIIDLLVETSKKMPTSIPIIATNDLKMIEYANKNGVYYITYINNAFYSNYPIHGAILLNSK